MNVNIFLYDDFETLDAFAPVSVFGQRPDYFHINYVSMYGDIVNSSQGVKVWTEAASEVLLKDILVIPASSRSFCICLIFSRRERQGRFPAGTLSVGTNFHE